MSFPVILPTSPKGGVTMVKLSCSTFPVVAAPFLEDPYSPPRAAKKKAVLGQGAFKGFLGMHIPQINKAFFFGGDSKLARETTWNDWLDDIFFHSCAFFFGVHDT